MNTRTRCLTTLVPGMALVMTLAGCANGADGDKGDRGNTGKSDQAFEDPSKAHFAPNQRPSQKLDLGDFDYEFSDIELSKSGEPDAFEVAQWRKHRHEAALRCLRATPPDYDQARSLLEEIVRNVPSASRDQALLAQLNFSDAAYWYQVGDRVAWEMRRVEFEKTAEPNGPTLDDKQLKELLASFKPYLERASEKLEKHAKDSLRSFEAYRRIRPDDKAVSDFVWKLYFYLQDYERALQWLDYVLREMDLAEVPEEEPIRADYTVIRKAIVTYLAESKLQGDDTRADRQGGGLFPFGDAGVESARDRLRKGYTPGR